MDSNVGLDYIVDNPDYCDKLASGKPITRFSHRFSYQLHNLRIPVSPAVTVMLTKIYGAALDTACPSVKKQVVELLSALCVYSQDGRQRAIDTLHIYQVSIRKIHPVFFPCLAYPR
jgi:hypothetical protein